MTTSILVTGGTGTLGRHLVPLLTDAGAGVRVLSRGNRPPTEGIEHVTADLLTGTGIDAALDRIDTVVHLAGSQKGDDVATAKLVAAAQRTGVRHLVYISVIGADRVPLGWLRSKLAAERTVAQSGVPWTILRAAQFQGLVSDLMRTMAKSPVIPAPGGLRFEPVDARDIAARLAELTLGPPAGRVSDLAGPTVYRFEDLARSYLTAVGKRRPFLPVRIPGKAGKAYRAGDNLAFDDADRGTRTWEEHLHEQRRVAA